MVAKVNIASPVNDKLDWNNEELKAKFPKTKNDINVPIPKPAECLLLIDGQIIVSKEKPTDVQTPIITQDKPDDPIVIGRFEMTSETLAMKTLDVAERAYRYGRGTWAKMSIRRRCNHMENFANDLENKVDEIAQLLMWEIGKDVKDSEDEVVRTVAYIRTAIEEAKALADSESKWQEMKGIMCQIRHLPYGVVLASSPFNYPLNEAYTTVIPALLMGNSVIVRAPRNGATPHFPTLELFAKHFPTGAI
jgi:glyceraldehyde-3-phosphate dehydrogenase (NADP+)